MGIYQIETFKDYVRMIMEMTRMILNYGFTMDLICFKHLVGGDWNMWMIFPYIRNNHPK